MLAFNPFNEHVILGIHHFWGLHRGQGIRHSPLGNDAFYAHHIIPDCTYSKIEGVPWFLVGGPHCRTLWQALP